LLLEKHGVDKDKLDAYPIEVLFVNPESYRTQANVNLMIYNDYRKSITTTQDI